MEEGTEWEFERREFPPSSSVVSFAGRGRQKVSPPPPPPFNCGSPSERKRGKRREKG